MSFVQEEWHSDEMPDWTSVLPDETTRAMRHPLKLAGISPEVFRGGSAR